MKVEDTNFSHNSIQVNGNLIDKSRPKIMGILNITQDSFYKNSRFEKESDLIKQAEMHLLQGADILDIGAFSTRPNGLQIEEGIENEKISWAVSLLVKNFPNAIISVDTFRASTAEIAIDRGASIINDISGFSFDKNLIKVLEKNKEIGYILMHLRGDFETMHQIQKYPNGIIKEVRKYFIEKSSYLKEKGIKNIILDPGFGFSKSMEDNHCLLNNTNELTDLNLPILVGISRKSMIYKKLNITPEEALPGTIALNAIALSKGASILRVHDVAEARQLVDLLF